MTRGVGCAYMLTHYLSGANTPMRTPTYGFICVNAPEGCRHATRHTTHTHKWDGLHTRHLLESTHTNRKTQTNTQRGPTMYSILKAACGFHTKPSPYPADSLALAFASFQSGLLTHLDPPVVARSRRPSLLSHPLASSSLSAFFGHDFGTRLVQSSCRLGKVEPCRHTATTRPC